ncbi:SDR family oxidoreductase [Pyxidicoccus parkwayensis]|uniref:SDR family oxidoreductase n=1 Tax=Pyxidicoccus parkwayensis TaxID=2813578 RepID=A0ABX7NUG1_9BACT|nr:SDR family oxidoreductase [Pyxidicoccus parkwaysis]QSQ22014.1 SDR family oxidoreductase [Pyxidicoccus parkwaysis]
MAGKVAIVTGASSGIGLGLTKTLVERGYSVVGTSRGATKSGALSASSRLALVDGDVGEASTARRVVDAALSRFGRVDLLVNNAGTFISKPFTDYTAEDYATLLSTNVAGFFHMTQAVLKQMVGQESGHVVNIGTSLARQPMAGVPGALAILTKGGIEAATRALAIEYAPHGVRVNTVAAGAIDTPMHTPDKHGFLETMSPANRVGTVPEVVDAVLYLDSAGFVSGEILHVDGGAHAGKW